jgi:hypothetical protein
MFVPTVMISSVKFILPAHRHSKLAGEDWSNAFETPARQSETRLRKAQFILQPDAQKVHITCQA